MAFAIEYTFVRPSTDVAWPEFSVDQQTQIQALRETHNVSSTDTFSEDNLTWVRRQAAESMEAYTPFYTEGQPIWEAAGIIYNAQQADITVSLDIIENT